MNLYLLFIPGALFLFVILFRVVIPIIKTPAWKRLIDSARYERLKKNNSKSDALLEKAVRKFPDLSQVYLEYFLSHSASGNIKKRFQILKTGTERAPHPSLWFFLGSAYLEEGAFSKAQEVFERDGCIKYMRNKKIPLKAELFFESRNILRAKDEYLSFYKSLSADIKTEQELIKALSARELLLYLLILKELGEDYRSVMKNIPVRSIHSDMGWKDLYEFILDEYKSLEPAEFGIYGDPERFNQRRKDYYLKRLHLIEEYIHK